MDEQVIKKIIEQDYEGNSEYYEAEKYKNDIMTKIVNLFDDYFNITDDDTHSSYILQFLQDGGYRMFSYTYHPQWLSHSTEEYLSSIMDLMHLCESSKKIEIKSLDAQHTENIIFCEGSLDYLQKIIIAGIKENNCLIGNDNWLEFKRDLKKWAEEKKLIKNEKQRLSFYLYTLNNALRNFTFKTTTEKCLFLHKLAIAYNILEEDHTKDLENCDDRKKITDYIKYSIKSYEDWKKKDR